MKEIETTFNSSVMECPYCGDTHQPEPEDYSEDERVEECENCGKKYHASQLFEVSHYARPNCALNGLEHSYVSNGEYLFCENCDHCRSAEKSED